MYSFTISLVILVISPRNMMAAISLALPAFRQWNVGLSHQTLFPFFLSAHAPTKVTHETKYVASEGWTQSCDMTNVLVPRPHPLVGRMVWRTKSYEPMTWFTRPFSPRGGVVWAQVHLPTHTSHDCVQPAHFPDHRKLIQHL